MRDRMKSFLVFTTTGYRIFAFLAVPLLGIMGGHLAAKLTAMPGYSLSVFLLVLIEIMLDHFIFGGICAKDVSHLEYLKCSKRGEWVAKSALTGGMIRMLLTMAVVFLGNHISFRILYPGASYAGDAVLLPVTLLVSAFAIIMSAAIVGRFSDALMVRYLLSMAGAALGSMVLFLVEKHLYLVFALSMVLAVLTGVLSVKIAMKHMKESYYDKTVTDGI